MTCHIINMRKHHAPGGISGTAPQLATDKVADTADTQPERRQRRDKVEHIKIVFVDTARVDIKRQHDAQKPAME